MNNGAILSAVGFYNVFDCIHTKYFSGTKIALDEIMDYISITIPYVVNGAFACEMAMKSAISDEHSKSIGHNLSNIYNSVYFKNEYKEAILNSFLSNGLTKTDFIKVLNESSNLFIEWRYFYEETKNQVTIPKNFERFVTACVETMLVFSDLERKNNFELH